MRGRGACVERSSVRAEAGNVFSSFTVCCCCLKTPTRLIGTLGGAAVVDWLRHGRDIGVSIPGALKSRDSEGKIRLLLIDFVNPAGFDRWWLLAGQKGGKGARERNKFEAPRVDVEAGQEL